MKPFFILDGHFDRAICSERNIVALMSTSFEKSVQQMEHFLYGKEFLTAACHLKKYSSWKYRVE